MADISDADAEYAIYSALVRTATPTGAAAASQQSATGTRDTYAQERKYAKFAVEAVKLAVQMRSSNGGQLQSLATVGQAGKTVGAGASAAGLEYSSFVISQISTSVSMGVKIAKLSSPGGALAGSLAMLGQKSAMVAGLASESELAKCRVALASLTASTAASAILGFGVMGWVAFSVGVADASLQCRNHSLSEIAGF